eukprot:6013900-Pleurochrysis_carterae.AAC.1
MHTLAHFQLCPTIFENIQSTNRHGDDDDQARRIGHLPRSLLAGRRAPARSVLMHGCRVARAPGLYGARAGGSQSDWHSGRTRPEFLKVVADRSRVPKKTSRKT